MGSDPEAKRLLMPLVQKLINFGMNSLLHHRYNEKKRAVHEIYLVCRMRR